MRLLAIFIGLLGLTACDSNRHVAFTSAAELAQPKTSTPDDLKTAAATKAADAAVTEAELAERREAKSEAEKVQKLRLALLEYRGNVEYVLTIIWSKPGRAAGEAAAFVPALDKLMAINAKLLKQSRLSEVDARMLHEGAEVLRSVRGTLVNSK